MLEQLDLTDDERHALEGDRDAITSLMSPDPAGRHPTSSALTLSLCRCQPRVTPVRRAVVMVALKSHLEHAHLAAPSIRDRSHADTA